MNKVYAYYANYAIPGPLPKMSHKMFYKNVPRGTIGVEQWNVDNFVDNVDNF